MPTVNTLTDLKCRQAKAGLKDQKLFDGYGLYLFISKQDSKIWRWTYRVDGKAQTASIGPYPLISLAEARTRRDALRLRHLNGEDIRAKAQKKPAGLPLSEAISQFWLNRHDITDKYRDNATRGLAMHLEPTLGEQLIGSITRDQLLAPLARVDASGHHVYARRLRMWVSLVFEWAIEHGHAQVNPATQIRPERAFGKRRVVHHAALKLSEVPDFLARLGFESELQSVLALRLLALTWVRTKELRMMEWPEIEGDLWRIPEHKMKRRHEHLIPLSPQALAILEKMRARSPGSRFVFPCDRRPMDRPMSENAILYLVYRMGYKGRMTGHGWRGIASTWANEREYNSDHIEMQLSHDEEDDSRAAYNSALYLSQRRKMLADFGNWFDAQVAQSVGAKRLNQADSSPLQG